jgi:hypothetical protein
MEPLAISRRWRPPALVGTRRGLALKYKDVEYAVIQGIDRQLWKWSVSVGDIIVRGQAATKLEAVAGVERAIDRALAPKKLRLIRLHRD